MAKITLNNVADLTNFTTAETTINNNNATIVTALENTFSRDGTQPNVMGADLDMNSNRIVNLPAPISSQEPMRLTDANTLNGGGTIQSIPAAGATGSILTKNNATNYDVSWLSGYQQPVSYPVIVTSGHNVPYLDSDAQFGNNYSQYPLGSVSGNSISIGKVGCSIGSSSVGQTFKIVFTSSGLTGSPITKTYTAIGGDTVTSIAAGLAALVNADPVLHGLGGKPIFMQPFTGGIFNLQYDAAFCATGATPLTTATTGSTGTITLTSEVNGLDFIIMQLGRNVAGRPARTGDGLYALDFTGQDSTGAFNTHYGQITVAVDTPTAGATRGLINLNTASSGGLLGRVGIKQGLYLYDSAGAFPVGGDVGAGIINVPTTGGYYVGGNAVGEFISSTVLVGSAISLTNGTPANITSISLTAGDWDVCGNICFHPAGTTTWNAAHAWTSTVSASAPTAPNNGAYSQIGGPLTTGADQFLTVGEQRINIGSTTTVYLSALAGFAVSTMQGYGFIRARRVK